MCCLNAEVHACSILHRHQLTIGFGALHLQISLNDTADEHILEVAWTCGAQRAELLCDLKEMSFQARRLA